MFTFLFWRKFSCEMTGVDGHYLCTSFSMHVCVASTQCARYPYNWYNIFASWGRGEGETLSIHVVSTQCASGLRKWIEITLDIQNDIHDTRTRKNYFYQEKENVLYSISYFLFLDKNNFFLLIYLIYTFNIFYYALLQRRVGRNKSTPLRYFGK